MSNVGRVDESGETSLAAATAAIIAARWASAAPAGGAAPAASGANGHRNGHSGSASVSGTASVTGTATVGGHGHAAWEPPVPTSPAMPMSHMPMSPMPMPMSPPVSPAPAPSYDYEPRSFEPQSFEPQSFEPRSFEPQSFERQSFQHPQTPAAPLARRVPSVPPSFDAPHDPSAMSSAPVSPAVEPMVHGRGEGTTIGAAAASFFAAAHLDAPPEVFGGRASVPMPRPAEPSPPPSPPPPLSPAPAADGFSFGSVMGDLPFPEPFPAEALAEPGGFTTFAPNYAPPEPEVDSQLPSERIPPGFERRTFEPPSNGFTSYEPGAGPGAPPFEPPYETPHEAPRPAVATLPKRTPQIPDVPDLAKFANDPLLDPSAPAADGRELSRIVSHLLGTDGAFADTTGPRPDGFDLNDVLEAVRGVAHVRDAHLRWNADQGHTLRIEFFDDADPGEVTRQVVRLLREKMGLAAEPSGSHAAPEETTLDRPVPRPRAGVVASARVPVRPATAAGPGARAPGKPLSTVDSAARVLVEHVQVTNLGVDATVDVRLGLCRGGARVGYADGARRGPAIDAYLLRPAAEAAADAVNTLLGDSSTGPLGRCFVEHVAVVPFGVVEVAVVVALLTHGHGGETDHLTGSAIVAGDPRQAVVRATLAALNRRLSALLA